MKAKAAAFNRNFVTYYTIKIWVAFNWILSITMENLRIVVIPEFFTSLPFLTYLSNKRPNN